MLDLVDEQATGTDPLVGRLIDRRYKVEKLLGQGAVGSVYRAQEQGERPRTVAIKIWHESALDEQILGRFKRESTALDMLVHPNVVESYGYGFVDDLPYMAMELLEGSTLAQLLSDRAPLDPNQALDIARQLLEALAYAHERSLVHRDIKPDNIFLVPMRSGGLKVKVLDYGLAKFLTSSNAPIEDKALTAQGLVFGTPEYMPPEQAAGGTIDLHTDVYAAGCVLFEMLTGQLPYLAESYTELVRMHFTEPVPRLSGRNSELEATAELQQLIDKSMAKKSAERFAHAGEMLEALQSLPPPPTHRRRSLLARLMRLVGL